MQILGPKALGLISFVLSLCVLPKAGHAGNLEFDFLILPVQNGKVILEKECAPNSKLTWTDEIIALTGGLKKNTKVWALTKEGKSLARLGEVSCYLGEECGGNYVSIELFQENTEDRREILGVTRLADLSPNTQLSPAKFEAVDLHNCSDLLAKISYDNLPEEPKARSCQRLYIGNGRQLEVGGKAFTSETGWPQTILKARIMSEGGGQASPVIDLDIGSAPLEPILRIDNTSTVIWRKAEGLCCPERITHRLSGVKGSEILFGESYAAGGQPCD